VNLARRLERLEAEMRRQTKGETPWLVYYLHEWAEGAPIAFEEGEGDEETIARMEANALDRLVAAGKIRDEHRDNVTFIVRQLVSPPKREDEPRPRDSSMKQLEARLKLKFGRTSGK